MATLNVRYDNKKLSRDVLVNVRVQVVEVKVDIDHALGRSAELQRRRRFATHDVRAVALVALVISGSGLALHTRSHGHGRQLGVGHVVFWVVWLLVQNS